MKAKHDLSNPPSKGVCQRACCGKTGLITTFDVCLDCHEAMRVIYQNHVPLAHKLAAKFFTRHPMGVRLNSIADANQVALLALWEGAKAFDDRRGYKPITIIYRYVWGRLQAAAETGVIRVSSHAFGKDSTPHLIAKAQKASLVVGMGPKISDNMKSDEPDMVDEIVRRDICQNVRRLVDQLPRRHAEVIRMRFGIEPYQQPLKLEQAGAKIGVTRERVRQIEAVALAKLTNLLYETTLGD